jgi:hypothetical protein
MPILEDLPEFPVSPARDLERFDRVADIIADQGGPTVFGSVKVSSTISSDGPDGLAWGVWFMDGTEFDVPYELVAQSPKKAAQFILDGYREAKAR